MGQQVSLEAANQHSAHAPFQDTQKMSQDERAKTMVREKNLNQALLALHAMDSAHKYAHTSDFLESHF